VIRAAAQWTFVLIVRFYQVVLGPLLPASCRYVPSCSVYAIEALEKHGPWRGGLLAVRRILRCHPFRPGGYDPVPD
jgi:putative membrane protein insertion efficiency factor